MNISIHEGINVNNRYYLFGRFRREKVAFSCHHMKSIKTNRYQLGTVNIKP